MFDSSTHNNHEVQQVIIDLYRFYKGEPISDAARSRLRLFGNIEKNPMTDIDEITQAGIDALNYPQNKKALEQYFLNPCPIFKKS